jgi:hypothetical protein
MQQGIQALDGEDSGQHGTCDSSQYRHGPSLPGHADL